MTNRTGTPDRFETTPCTCDNSSCTQIADSDMSTRATAANSDDTCERALVALVGDRDRRISFDAACALGRRADSGTLNDPSAIDVLRAIDAYIWCPRVFEQRVGGTDLAAAAIAFGDDNPALTVADARDLVTLIDGHRR